MLLVELQGVHEFEKVNHVVTIDIGTRTMWDPAERLVSSLISGELGLCEGDGFELTEVRELEVGKKQELHKGKKKCTNIGKPEIERGDPNLELRRGN